MVVDGPGQEVGKIVQPDADLGAAEHVAEGGVEDAAFLYKVAGQVSLALEQGAVAQVERGLYGRPDAGFKVRVQAVIPHHRRGDGAMSEGGGACLGVEPAGVAHEQGLARHAAQHRHGQQGGQVALAPAPDALAVEDGKAQAARGVHGVQQVKAADRQPA